MKIETLVQKLTLEEEWGHLQENPSTFLLENFLQKILNELERRGLILFYPHSSEVVYYDDKCLAVLAQIFKKVSPSYGLESQSPSIKEFCFEFSLSLEKKVERAARAWGWRSLDKILDAQTTSSISKTNNLDLTLESLDNLILRESLANCLLSESRFIRERRLFLENKLKKEETISLKPKQKELS